MLDDTVRQPSQLLIESLTPDEIFSLPEEYFAVLANTGRGVVKAGSAEILGQLHLLPSRLRIELAQIDGGGEGVLPTIAILAARLAKQRKACETE